MIIRHIKKFGPIVEGLRRRVDRPPGARTVEQSPVRQSLDDNGRRPAIGATH
jgi:hypothetical protein